VGVTFAITRKSSSNDLHGQTTSAAMLKIQHREWWLWVAAVLITLLLTIGLISFVIPMLLSMSADIGKAEIRAVVAGLAGLVLLFDIYVVYQQLQIYHFRRRLIEREEIFGLITENAADMIAVVDENGRRIYNSPSYERILGYCPHTLRGTTAFEQVHPDDLALVTEEAAHARTAKVGRRIEYRMRDTQGNWHVLESTATAIRDADGEKQRLVIVSRDITDRRRLEEQFRQSQKMEAIGRLSGGIAHDFNNLLGIIIGYAEVLQESTMEGHPDRECVDEIVRSGQRAASLTRQLLAFSRQQVLEPKIIDVNAIVTDVEKLLRRLIGEDIELITSLEHSSKPVKADQGQLEQVLLNLAVNARDAMPNGGRLGIGTHVVTMTELDVRRYSYPFKPGEYMKLTISDTGTGMDSATQARIFEPFFTTKEKGKGTGLGLAMVYGVVKQSDGYIEVDSQLGKGTTFTIYLPSTVEASPLPALEQGNLIAIPQGSETVLLVEDEMRLRFLTKNMLERFGYTVLDASNSAEACAVSAKRALPIDLLLTDIVMPGMNGLELAGRLMHERPGIKVLYMSGYTGQQYGQNVVPEGSHYLAKPFSRESLAAKVRQALRRESALEAPNLGKENPHHSARNKNEEALDRR
jgi:PAS domain S-box-containing protein